MIWGEVEEFEVVHKKFYLLMMVAKYFNLDFNIFHI